MTVDIRDKAIVSQLISQIENSENRDRKVDEWRSFEIHCGDQRKWVIEELKKLFPDSYKSMRVANVNVLKKVVDKLARVYKKEPKRTINGTQNDELDRIYKPFNHRFQSMDTAFNLHRALIMWVVNDPDVPSDFQLRTLPPYLFDILINKDTMEIEVVILSYPDIDITNYTSSSDDSKAKRPDGVDQAIAESPQDGGANSENYAIWTKDYQVNIATEFKITGDDFDLKKIDFVFDDSNPQMINPLGQLPFVWLTTHPDMPDFPLASPLPYESININVLSSDLLTASALQGFGQLVLKYPEGSKIAPKHTGFTTAIELPQKNDPDAPETTAEYINPSPDLNGMRSTIMEYAEAVISDAGLQNFSLAGSKQGFKSGLDRALSMADVSEIREEHQMMYAEAEEKIFEIIKAYDQLNKTKLFGRDDQLNVVYEQPKVIQSEKESQEILQWDWDMGLLTRLDVLMRRNHKMNKDEAEEKLKEIDQERSQRTNGMLSRVNGDNQEREREES